MFEFFLVLFGGSAFLSALDFSNCQMRQKKKINFIIYFYFWGRVGREMKGFDVSSCCQYEEFM